MSPAQRRAELDQLLDRASELLARAGEQPSISQEVLLGSRDRGLRRRAVFSGRRLGSR